MIQDDYADLDGSDGWYAAKAGVVGMGPLAVGLEAVVDLVRLGGGVGRGGLVL
jgi:hypothetical protein